MKNNPTNELNLPYEKLLFVKSAMQKLANQSNDPFDHAQIPLKVPTIEFMKKWSDQTLKDAHDAAKAWLASDARVNYDRLWEIMVENNSK